VYAHIMSLQNLEPVLAEVDKLSASSCFIDGVITIDLNIDYSHILTSHIGYRNAVIHDVIFNYLCTTYEFSRQSTAVLPVCPAHIAFSAPPPHSNTTVTVTLSSISYFKGSNTNVTQSFSTMGAPNYCQIPKSFHPVIKMSGDCADLFSPHAR